MNRRDFLKSLAAIGVALTVPFEALTAAPDSVIDSAWQAALDSPATFYVGEYGTLSTDAELYYPSTRAEMLQLDAVCNYDDLVSLAHDECGVASLIEDWMTDDQDGVAHPESDWTKWIARADEDTVGALITRTNNWLDAEPDSGDWESATIRGNTGQGSALHFFRDVFDESDMFNIVIIEGDCPGSSYFAAELQMGIDEANVLAAEYDIPMRFAQQG